MGFSEIQTEPISIDDLELTEYEREFTENHLLKVYTGGIGELFRIRADYEYNRDGESRVLEELVSYLLMGA